MLAMISHSLSLTDTANFVKDKRIRMGLTQLELAVLLGLKENRTRKPKLHRHGITDFYWFTSILETKSRSPLGVSLKK